MKVQVCFALVGIASANVLIRDRRSPCRSSIPLVPDLCAARASAVIGRPPPSNWANQSSQSSTIKVLQTRPQAQLHPARMAMAAAGFAAFGIPPILSPNSISPHRSAESCLQGDPPPPKLRPNLSFLHAIPRLRANQAIYRTWIMPVNQMTRTWLCSLRGV